MTALTTSLTSALSRPRRRALLAAAAVALAAAGVVLAAPGSEARKVEATCEPTRATVAHKAGGAVVKRTPLRIACASETGYYTGETTIAVTKQGTVWFSAADWEWALVRSADRGKTWERVTPGGPQAMPGCYVATSPATCMDTQGAKNGTVADGYVYADPATGKVFWSKTFGFAVCSSLSMTPDDGKTWQANTNFACPGADYEKIAAGPAPAGTDQPVGYPSVVYGCTNGPTPFFVVGPGRACYKSLDGGASFETAGYPVPSPLAPGCLHFQEAMAVAPDGTVVQPLSCGNDANVAKVRIALSKDQGTTWSYVAVPVGPEGNGASLIGGAALSIDKAGTIYVIYRGTDQKPYLAVTKDQGASWTGPFMVGKPGVTTGGPLPQVVAGKPGHVAIGYYGHTGDATRLHGYLTESFDATAANPTWHSAQLNDPKQPLYFPTEGGTLPRNDYLGVAMGPDETPWVGLVKLVSATPDGEGYIQSTGFVGRLAFR